MFLGKHNINFLSKHSSGRVYHKRGGIFICIAIPDTTRFRNQNGPAGPFPGRTTAMPRATKSMFAYYQFYRRCTNPVRQFGNERKRKPRRKLSFCEKLSEGERAWSERATRPRTREADARLPLEQSRHRFSQNESLSSPICASLRSFDAAQDFWKTLFSFSLNNFLLDVPRHGFEREELHGKRTAALGH